MGRQILIVDDIPAMCEQYAYDLKRLGGYQTLTAHSGEQALEIVRAEPVDCMILDLEMPGMDGFDVLKALRKAELAIPVIVYTGTGNYERCVRAVKLGAYNFIDKGEPMERVVQEIENALERHRLQAEVSGLKERLGEDSPLIGEAPAMKKMKRELARLAPIPSTVLITGESGSGKELVARELHRLSPRSRGPFLPVNCAALPENLIESELFGHEAGAFTGATRLRKGAFEAAGGGSLFLDEVGELPAPAQAKLLRVLEDLKVSRVGGTRQIDVDVRVIAATNRDLEEEIRSGRFRDDLYYRLNVHVLRVPPLRERIEDIPALVEHLMDQMARRLGTEPKEVMPAAMAALQACDWRRNNVRELRNALERILISAEGPRVQPEHLPSELSAAGRGGAANGPPGMRGAEDPGIAPSEVGPAGRSLRDRKEAAERRIVLEALERHGWHISKTAEDLGLADHSSLLKVMRRLGIRRG